ncbi:P63C domain-containing protein [Gemmatimonas sp.]|uniref:P63C domain-containing protein n=1 Tax=Gemmatimonas sp. TaxID=1962908 RepID=UPI00286EA26E|nr:P63C domain-containing protein [Gemmatimonas sp.]
MSDDAKKFGAMGGKKSAANMSKKALKERAQKASQARWQKGIPTAQYGSPDRPLRIGDLEIPCYVLDDQRRVLIQRGMMTALDIKQGTATRGAGDRLSKFIGTKALSSFVSPELGQMITNPIVFQVGGATAYGYEATILADICDAVLAARKAGALNYQQDHIAEQCELLVRAFARVGIVALVDEATGFQAERSRDALAKILESFVQKELRKWVRTFPPQYYEQLCRLRDVAYPPPSMKLPQYFGILTNSIVYDRLAPGVKDELKRITPRTESGKLKDKMFQRLTDDVGNPKLLEHLASVVALMKISPDYETFELHLNKALPKWSDTLQLALDD